MNVVSSTHDRSPGQEDIEEENVSEAVSESFKQRKKSRVQKRLTDDMEVTDSESNSGLASSVEEDCDSQIEESLPEQLT